MPNVAGSALSYKVIRDLVTRVTIHKELELTIVNEQRDLVRELRIDRKNPSPLLDPNRIHAQASNSKIRHHLIEVLRLEPQADHPLSRRRDRGRIARREMNFRTADFHRRRLPVCQDFVTEKPKFFS